MNINEFLADDINYIVSQYKSGVSLCELASQFNCSRKPIRKILVCEGVTIRGQRDASTKYTFNFNYFNQIDTPNKAYILGFLYADGCNYVEKNSGQYRVQLQLKQDDNQILEDIKREIEYTGPIYYNERVIDGVRRKYATLCIANKQLSQKISEFGVVPSKTYITEYPEWMDVCLLPHFLRGLFDGDGCINNIGHVSISGTYSLMSRIAELVKLCKGLEFSLYAIGNAGNTYTINLCTKAYAAEFLGWIYNGADLKLNRKYKRYANIYC